MRIKAARCVLSELAAHIWQRRIKGNRRPCRSIAGPQNEITFPYFDLGQTSCTMTAESIHRRLAGEKAAPAILCFQ